ncbi:MAG: NAD(P)/FAD-dependent oxidoreductase, partial [Candidatus Rokuibacteriota bacterium]
LCMSEGEARWGRAAAAAPPSPTERVEFLGPEDLRRLEPEATTEARGALYLPQNGWVNNDQLVAALVRAATRRGVRFLLGQPVEEVLQAGGRVTGVRARGVGTVDTGRVVLAAGAWTGEIKGVPPELTLRAVKGQMLALGHSPKLFRHALVRDDVYLVPRASGECLVGATVEEDPVDKSVTPAGLHWLLTEALITLPALARSPFRRAWAGLRPATPDGLPVIGPWPGLSGLVVATGHHRNGILLAPVTARIVREWIVDGRCSLAVDAFRPDRLQEPRPTPE